MRAQPVWARVTWGFLGMCIVVLAVHSIVQPGDDQLHNVLDNWVANGAELVAATMCLLGAKLKGKYHSPWTLFGIAMVLWAVGHILWSINGDPATLTSISDVFWLAWYPLVLTGLAILVRARVPGFEFHRWVDGVVVMLLVATPWIALFLEPAADKSSASTLAAALDFAYPLLDAVVLGAVVGAIALTAWRPGRMWLLLGIGFASLCVADAVYSLEALARNYTAETGYDALWLLGITLVAYCAWLPRPTRLQAVPLSGWRAIALPVVAQLVAIGIQVYGLFHYIGTGERAITIVVLAIANVQIVATRPTPDTDPEDAETLGL
ncbi:MAG: hypothetical protein U0W40_12490 [Acidimicrobiia bacterium]